jgi:prepilin-type N-terminal cleavage/methylation domain-containing protein
MGKPLLRHDTIEQMIDRGHRPNTNIHHNTIGFTIVELLIVIVVIAILAAITVVAFTGVQQRAHDTAIQQDLRNWAMKIQQFEADNGRYPTGGSALPGGSTTSELAFAFSKNSYAGEIVNVYYCYGLIGGAPSYAVGALSRSGKAFGYSLQRGAFEYTGTWSTNNVICPGLMQLGSTPPSYSWNYGRSGSSSWFSWTNG